MDAGSLFWLALIGVGLLIVIVRAIRKMNTGKDFDRVMSGQAPQGVRAYGLILSASRTATPVNYFGRVMEQRYVVLEVEIPGQQPYQVNTQLSIPLGLVEARPGDTLELSVSPGNPNNVTVLGPGGFTGPWLRPLGYNGGVNLGGY
jgi:hypothetical protein